MFYIGMSRIELLDFCSRFSEARLFNFQMGMELRVHKAFETNSLQVSLTNDTDAQFNLALQSTLSTPFSCFNKYKEAEKRYKERQKKKKEK